MAWEDTGQGGTAQEKYEHIWMRGYIAALAEVGF
jgi:hypothetical protein